MRMKCNRSDNQQKKTKQKKPQQHAFAVKEI